MREVRPCLAVDVTRPAPECDGKRRGHRGSNGGRLGSAWSSEGTVRMKKAVQNAMFL